MADIIPYGKNAATGEPGFPKAGDKIVDGGGGGFGGAADLTWKNTVTAKDYLGTRTIVEINALSPIIGQTIIASDAGTPTAGTSDALVAGSVTEFDGTSWQELVAGSGGFVPSGTRLLVHDETITLFSPLTDNTDESKIAEFDGTTNTPALTTQINGDAVLVSGEPSVFKNKGWTYNSSSATWVQFTGGPANAVDVQSFTSSGTWNKPSSGLIALVRVWGGGGGGGSTAGSDSPGGGGGGFVDGWFALSVLGATEIVTIGAGGAGSIGVGAGNNGGNSTFGSHLTGFGGGGGTGDGGGGGGLLSAGSGSSSGNPSDAPGSFGGGFVPGGFSAWGGGGGSSGVTVGGSSFRGGGGGGGETAGTSINGGDGGTEASPGNAGTQPGGGGGGGLTSSNGGVGGAGQIEVYVF